MQIVNFFLILILAQDGLVSLDEFVKYFSEVCVGQSQADILDNTSVSFAKRSGFVERVKAHIIQRPFLTRSL